MIAASRNSAAGKAGARPAAHDGDVITVGQLDDFDDVLLAARENYVQSGRASSIEPSYS